MQGLSHTLKPGDVVCGSRGERMETLLGSCVAIVLTDPRRTLGAMCHIVHTGRASKVIATSGAYGEVAFDMMFAQLRAHGIDPLQCEAYVYGGGNMFPDQFCACHVGKRNADWVLDHLADYRIHVVSCDLCGCAYRRLSWTVGPIEPHVIAVPV